MRSAALLALVFTFIATVAVGDELVLPPGDAARGQAAFVKLRCHSCHRVQGVRLPSPVASPPVPITLGEAPSSYTDAYLVTSIIAPSHNITRSELGESVASKGVSRMGDFTSVMTVRQLVDIVTFLRKHARR